MEVANPSKAEQIYATEASSLRVAIRIENGSIRQGSNPPKQKLYADSVRNGVNTGPAPRGRDQRLSSHASILTTRGPPTQ